VVKLAGRIPAGYGHDSHDTPRVRCDLFSFVAELSEPHGKISLAEAIFLTALLALCIVAFVIRRSREERRDVVRQVTDKIRLQEFKREASQDSLTSLANRRSILDALNAATAFPLIDLNDFTMAIDPKKKSAKLLVYARHSPSALRPLKNRHLCQSRFEVDQHCSRWRDASRD
jgi:hypothetical protein